MAPQSASTNSLNESTRRNWKAVPTRSSQLQVLLSCSQYSSVYYSILLSLFVSQTNQDIEMFWQVLQQSSSHCEVWVIITGWRILSVWNSFIIMTVLLLIKKVLVAWKHYNACFKLLDTIDFSSKSTYWQVWYCVEDI